MRIFTAILTVLIAVVFVGSAMAVPPGKTLEFTGSPLGKVVFDGKLHMAKGNKCPDCHTKIFGEMKPKPERLKMKMADLNAGKFCGTCHNGEKVINGVTVFKTSDPANCKKCHKK